MQIKYLKAQIMRSDSALGAKLAEKNMTADDYIEIERIKKVELWENFLKADSDLTVKEAAAKVDEPIANLYRWKKDPKVYSTRPKNLREAKHNPELVKAVLKTRKENKTWGKRKIWARVTEEGFDTSVSTVGRILSSKSH